MTVPHLRLLLRQRSVVRFGSLLLILGLLGLALLLVPRPDLATAPHLVDRLGPTAPVAAVLVGALLMVALVPRTLVTVAWGALFGPLGGAAYTLAAALVAAALGFTVGRLLGRDFIAERVRGRLARLDGWFSRQSVLGVITVRLLPVGGFGLVSYGYGTTGARVTPFLVGSVLASAPSAFGYAAVGAAVVNPDGFNWLAVAPAGFGLIGSVLASVPSAFGYAAVGAAVASPDEFNWLAVAPAGFGLIATAVLVARWRKAEQARRTPPTP